MHNDRAGGDVNPSRMSGVAHGPRTLPRNIGKKAWPFAARNLS